MQKLIAISMKAIQWKILQTLNFIHSMDPWASSLETLHKNPFASHKFITQWKNFQNNNKDHLQFQNTSR